MKTELMGTSNDATDLLLDVVLSRLRKIPDQVVAQLHKRDVVSSTQDCYRQIRDIQLDHDTFWSTKETYDEELRASICYGIVTSPQNPTPAPLTPPPISGEIEKLITCPITLEFMKDPIMIVQSEQTCVQESLCQWLLEHPSQCPVSSQNFGTKLDIRDNLVTQQLLMHFMDDEAYQKYNDTDFNQKYSTLWKEPDNTEAKLILPDKKMIHLPNSSLSIGFTGTSPIISSITDNSSFWGEVLVGMAIDTLEMPGSPTYMQLCWNQRGCAAPS